ncbi:hypothetical protein AAFO92_13820 [Roseovarius sp. CAU 1744]|uniref:hypothetical protein n=1 Tax=Roseovarius sp. CAU 1744 TaxID=3140368 RepID=UPI00325AADFB
MAIAKLWHYKAITGEEALAKTNGLQLEPYVSRQQVTTSSSAVVSTPSPAGTHLLRIETTVETRYRINLPGQSGDADANDPMTHVSLDSSWNWIPMPPGSTISLIEA